MERKLSVSEARENFSELVEQVQHQGDAYIISRHGKPAAVVVPLEVYENWKRERRAFFDSIRRSQTQANLQPEIAEKLAAEAATAARNDTLTNP